MPTTIAPSTGATPSFLQAGQGASPGYSAIDVRRLLFGVSCQEGVIDAGSFEVTQRAAGANMSVDIAASTGNGALVQGDSVTSQGLYHVAPHSAAINETVTAADATNPRIDQAILEVLDDTHAAGGSNLARVRIVAGTPTSGATLDNRNGAASLPSSAIRLADILVGAAASSITNSVCRDRRPWARGAGYYATRASGDLTTTTTAAGSNDLDTLVGSGTTFTPRLEFSGSPVEVRLTGSAHHSVDNTGVVFSLEQDTAGSFAVELARQIQNSAGAAGQHGGVLFAHRFTPSAGSYRLRLKIWGGAAGTTTLRGDVTVPFNFIVDELVRQNARQNATTTG